MTPVLQAPFFHSCFIRALSPNRRVHRIHNASPHDTLVDFISQVHDKLIFSNRNKTPGIYLMSLKSWKAQPISTQEGESLNWAALPPVPQMTPEQMQMQAAMAQAAQQQQAPAQ